MSSLERKANELNKHAPYLRERILRMVNAARTGHPGGSLSVIDLLSATMLGWGRFAPNLINPDWVVLGKGHAVPALYSILIELGYFEEKELFTYRKFHSRLQGHPDKRKLPSVQVSTGHLGQGLSIGVGIAAGERLSKSVKHVYVILGDGDLNEGQTWEAIQTAAHYHLSNVTVLVDANGLTQHGPPKKIMNVEPVLPKWESFGWWTKEIDGHDYLQILNGLKEAGLQKIPAVIICRTIKGKGISFMEGNATWHSRDLPNDLLAKALKEIHAEE